MISKTNSPDRFLISDYEQTKWKVLDLAKRFSTFCFLDNHHYPAKGKGIECLLAAGAEQVVTTDAGSSLAALEKILQQKKWLFGHCSYELKNEWEKNPATLPDDIGFPSLYFFEPIWQIRLSEDELVVEKGDPQEIFLALQNDGEETAAAENDTAPLQIHSRFSETEYIETIQRLREHIHRGDCYEINFCQDFYAEKATIDPFKAYRQLSRLSPNPFSALYRQDDHWLICASPERFLKKSGNHIISQPIKGTVPRNRQDELLDEAAREQLHRSAKDRSENVMVVDLVRNDLSRICREGTVKVDELFGIYSFPQVYQMISTISGELNSDTSFTDIMHALFPMGSMTGAPKKSVMELISKYEKRSRGIFSGALGYFNPEGDFDFNVVIRSILYNASTGYLSFPAGSGITWYSDPKQEWEECLVKAAAIRQVLENKKD